MSGDVQPRKRKDKRRRKDELSVEEPRGTAAVLGEGDVFIHSHHDHGTGGHWCAKVIFFSLLAVLVTLIGLIILENRGLSELEANSVESRYSGVLEGWIEDAPDDDHHDEHTLELKHHDEDDEHDDLADEDHDDHEENDESDESDGADDDDEVEHADEDDDDEVQEGENDIDEDNDKNYDNENDDENDTQEDEDENDTQEDDDENEDAEDEDRNLDSAETEEDEEENNYRNFYEGVNTQANIEEDDDDDDDDDNDYNQGLNYDEGDDDHQELEDDGNEESNLKSDDDNEIEENDQQLDNDDNEDARRYDDSNEYEEFETRHQHEEEGEDEDEEEDREIEVEKIEKEVSDEEVLQEAASSAEEDDKSGEQSEVESPEEDKTVDEEDQTDDEEEFLEPEDIEEPVVVERITAPPGKPLPEVEEETSSEAPPDTLAEEEEYERQQEELRRQQEQASHQDGGNSLEDEWPGEPTEQYWREQLDEAERELQQGAWGAAERRAGAGALAGSARARFVRARALDAAAEARRDNRLLSQAITAYLELLKMNERLSDKKLLEVTNRTLDRIRFRGNYMNAEPIYRLLIRRFPNDPSHRNNLSIAFLMANRPDLAEKVLKETLLRWPDDRVALAHLGFVLKTSYNKLEEAVDAMRKALEGDIGAANEPRFYFHLGDALLMLGRFEEAHEVHKRGAALGHFLSPAQRSLYNVERLKSRPWWNIEQTPYQKLAQALEASWRSILKEGEAARALYEKEKEGLKERGEWSQLDLFIRGQELPGRCKKAPVTCSIVRQEMAAIGCKRGQIKFSAMEAGTHVRPHVGPTNCRLRMHLGLSNTKDTYIRVDKETRSWHTGKVLLFDDSFEHEVWHNGTGTRLVLIVDVWHPDLTPAERRQLPAI